ncbi:MAG: hypothetical protein FWD79_09215 [Desulfobulbus sp.]|nr:hypothetical protein [Desulfobulbus sp.]
MVTLPEKYHFSYPDTSIVYHYCSLSTFMKIVEGKSLWLTSIDKMNDYAEGGWFVHIINKLCSEKLFVNVVL